VQPLHLLRRGRAACHCADGRRALSAFNASRPIRWQAASRSSSRRHACWVCWRTVHPCQAVHCVIPSTRSFPSTPKIPRSRMTGHKGIASAANIYSPKCYILYVSGPICRGPVPLCMPPSTIKGEACDVTHTRNLRSHLRLASSYKLSSNTSHGGVGYYAPAARTTLNPCVFLSASRSFQRSSKTPKPLLISGFRAGALRHPAGDLLSDIWRAR
jgi:hypothetical protein